MPHLYRILSFLLLWTGLAGLSFSQSDTPTAVPVRTGHHRNVDRSDDWPRFLGNRYDGVSPRMPKPINWNQTPKLIWSLDVGEGYGVGAVSGKYYIHFDALTKHGDMLDERLRAIDLATGEEVWTSTQNIFYRDLFGYEPGPRSTPSVDLDQVYTLGVSGMLTCRDRGDGHILWSVDTNQKYDVVQNFFGVGSSPLVLGDRVIVMVGGSPSEDQNVAPMRLDRVSPNGSAVVAFDRDTGKEIWKCGDDLASYSSPRPMEIDGKMFVLALARNGLLLIDPDNGDLCWRVDHRASILESVNAMTPVVDGNHVFLSECYEVGSVLLKVDANSANVVWRDPPRDRRRQAMRCHWATPVLVDGFLYGCSGRNAPDSDFRCIHFKTGDVQWKDSRRIRSSVTRVGEHLVVLEERGKLQIIHTNPTKMDVIATWSLDEAQGDRPALDYPCWAAPIIVDQKLIVRGTDRVLCFQLPL